MLTTIQISDQLRRKLKVLTAHRGISYSELLEDLIDVYESTIPFKSDEEFRNWFIQNLKQFNLHEIIKENPPHYVITDKKGKHRKISLYFNNKDTSRKGYDSSKPNLFITVYSTQDQLKNTPILPLIKLDKNPENLLKVVEGRSTPISIPISLYNKAKKTIKNTGFSTVSSYITFIMREILVEHSMKKEETINKEDEEKVKKRLKTLGYL
jgi:hypothetical protein